MSYRPINSRLSVFRQKKIGSLRYPPRNGAADGSNRFIAIAYGWLSAWIRTRGWRNQNQTGSPAKPTRILKKSGNSALGKSIGSALIQNAGEGIWTCNQIVMSGEARPEKPEKSDV
jgi:hypothetical protein